LFPSRTYNRQTLILYVSQFESEKEEATEGLRELHSDHHNSYSWPNIIRRIIYGWMEWMESVAHI